MKVKFLICLCTIIFACNEDTIIMDSDPNETDHSIQQVFGNNIDPEHLDNYETQGIPVYINADNSAGNQISNEGATLGRVLFYDKNLSVDQSVSCASCHQQSFAFSDPEALSSGVNGMTARHSMRLINARFSRETQFFWDERASSLEEQTTMPIQDHAEMGFSGQNGAPDIEDLTQRLSQLDYYNELFTMVYGDVTITEERIQLALAQFVRSIQSFDSKYDEGRAMVNNDNVPFPNFTNEENLGKFLFRAPPQNQGNTGLRIGGGLGCAGCHRAAEFDIDPASGNNGVTFTAQDPSVPDYSVTRAPSLRDILNPSGQLNGPLMHTGTFTTMEQVIDHYNEIDPQGNPNLDIRLRRGGGQQLNITLEEKSALIAFLKTLSGTRVYTEEKWSDPFPD